MAPLKQPPKLSNHVLQFVQRKVVALCYTIAKSDFDGNLSSEDHDKLCNIRDYMEEWLPITIASTMIEDIFKDVSHTTSLKLCILHVLNFPDRTTTLILGMMSESHYSNFAQYLRYNCSSIENLNVRGIWLVDKSRDTFCEALGRMPQLKHLSVPYITNTCMIKTLSRKCAHLTTLDMSGSSEVYDEDLLILGSLRATLQVVNLGGPGSRSYEPMTVAKLINCLPKLVSLGTYQLIGQAVNILQKDLGRSHPTKLKYIHDRATTALILSSLHTMCPGNIFYPRARRALRVYFLLCSSCSSCSPCC
jgi:hypothetical protein